MSHRGWALALIASLATHCTCASSPAPVPVVAPAPVPDDDDDVDDDDDDDDGDGLFQKARVSREIEALEALGYVEGAQPAPSRSGVVRHAPDASEGRRLWTSGHAPEAYLMSLDGAILHRWARTYEELFPTKLQGEGKGRSYWRRVLPFEDGSLIAVFEAQGLVKLDRDSQVIWTLHAPVHHDLKRLPDGRLLTLTRKAHVKDAINPRRPVLEDFVAILSADGVIEREVSVVDAVLASEFASAWAPRKKHGDLFHTNAVVMLDGRWADRLPAFTAGRVLVSVRAWDALLVIDLDLGKVVWVGKGNWRAQHDPRVLDDTLLLFDNLGTDNRSRVLELDPTTLSPVWSYEGTHDEPFFSRFCGAAHRLADGSTLISDSWSGRAFETDAQGVIRWEFLNPHRAGEADELIAVLPEMLPLPADWGDAWLPAVPPND